MDHKAGRLIYDEQRLIFIQDIQRHGLSIRALATHDRIRNSDSNSIPGMQLLRRLRRVPVEHNEAFVNGDLELYTRQADKLRHEKFVQPLANVSALTDPIILM